jgi:uncharacterized protein YjeT (DUF2065 family)
MTDLLVALGLVLVIEGLLWAMAPGLGRYMLAKAAELPDQSLRISGAVTVAVGVGLVWLVRG